MNGDCISTHRVVVDIQENGIIRLASDGYLIGRLSRDFSFEQLKEKPIKHVIFTLDEFEHILNCFDNLFFIREQSEETQKEWVETIRKANHNARAKWSKAVRDNVGSELDSVEVIGNIHNNPELLPETANN